MTFDSSDQTTVTRSDTPAVAPEGGPAPAPATIVRTDRHVSTTTTPAGTEMSRRIIVLLFGLIQVVISLRFVLLLLDAREANGLVSAILNFSQIFVAPFDGILRTNYLSAAGSVFDVTAVVAIVGWTILELIILWVIGIFRREPA